MVKINMNADYMSLRHRYPGMMKNLTRLTKVTEYSSVFENKLEIEPIIHARHAAAIAAEITRNNSTSENYLYVTVVRTDVFVCTPLEFWEAVEYTANELARHREMTNLKVDQ